MFHYRAYNLIIASELQLPELHRVECDRADVFIRLVQSETEAGEWSDEPLCHVYGDSVQLIWPQLASFWIAHGREILVRPSAAADEALIRLPLLGTVMATLLHQRGLLVLHASAVAINSEVHIFLAEKGQGKSTLAAALCAHGYALLSDDIVALYSHNQQIFVLPGYPHIKLWPQSIAALGYEACQFPRLGPDFEKRLYTVDKAFAAQQLPLRHIFILEHGPGCVIEKLPAQSAILQLLAHSYVARFGAKLLHDQYAVRHFQQCQTILQQTPVHRLQYIRDYWLLPTLISRIEQL